MSDPVPTLKPKSVHFVLRATGDLKEPPVYFAMSDNHGRVDLVRDIRKAHRFATEEEAKAHPANLVVQFAVESLLMMGPKPDWMP